VPLDAIKGRLVSASPSVSQLRVAAADGATDRYRGEVTAALRTSHELGPEDDNDFITLDPTNLDRGPPGLRGRRPRRAPPGPGLRWA
jgi:hypothetical protein